MELRHINFQYVDVFTYLGTHHTIGILWKLPHVRLIEFYLLHFQSLSSFQRSRGGGRAKISSHGLVFLLTGLHPGAYPESPHQIKRCFQCSYHLGNYKEILQEIYARNQKQRQIYIFPIIIQKVSYTIKFELISIQIRFLYIKILFENSKKMIFSSAL